jgi:serine/threonine protein kinase
MDTDLTPLLGISLGNYHLEQIVEQHPLGPLFQARHQRTGATFLLRVLTVDRDLASRASARPRDLFQQFAAHLETLRHPYILPILDADQLQGLSFLVFPSVPTRTLGARIRQSGPLDLAAVGRYLDQLAAALEYASEHGIVHGALTIESMFLQLDSRLLVADFGAQHILTSRDPASHTWLAQHLGEAAAPEQLLGHPAQTTTDVYALGIALFHLLTGYPAYAGRTSDEVARQILNAPIPSLRQWRPDLPAELDALLAQALAKNPAQRFRRPGMLANAYHQIVSPRNAARIAFAEGDPQPLAEQPMARVLAHPNGSMSARSGPASAVYSSDLLQAPLTPPPPPAELLQPGIPYPPLWRFGPWRIAIGVTLAVLIVLGSIFFISTLSKGASQATGSVQFSDEQGGHSNSLNITASHLAAPPSGSHYQAWLFDTSSEQILPLGSLVAHGQTYTLQYTNGGNLLGTGNEIEITLEHQQTEIPLGNVVLTGTFPPKAFVHIGHLLVSYPVTPGKIGLLVGTIEQISLLDSQAHQLQSAGDQNANASRCFIQSMIAIAEGAHGAHVQPLAQECRQADATGGDGFGLLGVMSATGLASSQPGYLAEAADHATLARQQPDATAAIRSHADNVIATLSHIQGWITTLDTDLASLLKTPTDSATIAQVVTLADNAYYGAGNAAQSLAPVKASSATGGALYAYSEGQTMATLPLVP